MAGHCICCQLYLTWVLSVWQSSPLCLPDDFRKQMKLQSPRAWSGSSDTSDLFVAPAVWLYSMGRARGFHLKKIRRTVALQWSSLFNSKTAAVSSLASTRCALLTSDHPGQAHPSEWCLCRVCRGVLQAYPVLWSSSAWKIRCSTWLSYPLYFIYKQ